MATGSSPASMRVSALYLYPVKSLRGFAVDSAEVDDLGFVGDRRFLVVRPDGVCLTQRDVPEMALVETKFGAQSLILSRANAGRIEVPLRASDPEPPLRSVSVWKSIGLLAEDCGDTAAGWLAEVLRTECRLVRIGPKYHRPVLKATARPGDVTSFTDAFPLLAISEATLADLNRRLVADGAASVPMNRFRPNLVISGSEPYAEDTWPRFRVGEIVMRAGGPCTRCIIPTIDQATAQGGKEPLRMLASYRRDPVDPTNVNFGQNLLHETKRGTVRVGDPVVPLA